MEKESLKQLVLQGLTAMKSGLKVAEQATSEIQKDVSHPRLKQALEEGTESSKQWADRVEQALREAGASDQEQSNVIMEANYKVAQKLRKQTKDEVARDLGIIASGQLALHYWIASFGTVRTYADQAGLSQTSQNMQLCLDEAKEADEAHNQIAAELLGVSREQVSRPAKSQNADARH